MAEQLKLRGQRVAPGKRRGEESLGGLKNDRDFSPIFWLVMVAILLLLIGLPLFWLLYRSFSLPKDAGFTLDNYTKVFTTPRYLEATKNSIVLALGSATLGTVLGVPMAWAIARTNMPLRGLMRVLVLVGFTTPPFLGGIAWVLLAGPNSGELNKWFVALTGAEKGPINIYTMVGAIFVVGIYSYPYTFLTVSSALEFVSSELEDAATVLGSGTFKTMFRITLPLVLPSILSGFLLSFLEALALFGSPTLLLIPARTPIITTEMWQAFQYPSNVELASAFAIPLLLITAGLLWLQRRIIARRNYTTLTGKGGQRRTIDLGGWRWAFLGLCVLVSLLSLGLPFFMLIRTSLSKAWGKPFGSENLTLQWYDDVLFKQPATTLSIQNSLLYSAGAATFAMIVGIAIAYIVNRQLIKGWRFLTFIAMIPLVIPGIVIAIGIFSAYSRPPLILYGTGLILIVAYTTRFLPMAFSNSSDIFKSVNPELELAARNLGSTQLSTVRKITVPLVKRGLIGGWILVFILAVRELSCAILLFSTNTQVMPTILFEMVNEGSFERVAALGVVMLVIIFAVVGLAYKLLGRDFMLDKK
jgi:iron(III) transport system permease protein